MSVSQTALSVLGLKTVLLLAEKPCLIEIPGKEVVSTSGKSKPVLGERLSQPGVCLHKGCSGRTVLELTVQHRLLRGLASGSNELHGVWRGLGRVCYNSQSC